MYENYRKLNLKQWHNDNYSKPNANLKVEMSKQSSETRTITAAVLNKGNVESFVLQKGTGISKAMFRG